ncbi:glycosyltransferase family 4 protein [Methanoregula sp.]|uniref:glycosyltransferase family 4 protein n=1 Tax=Methanoregula sp. TaxID=2052170 RepID=UPI00356AC7C5
MKALHITFRYGKDICGGAELYFRHISEELSKRGVDVDICTTQSHTLTPFIKSGTAFDNSLENETINNIKVFRFPVKHQNRYLSFFFEKIIQKQLDKEELESSSEIRKIIQDSFLENGGILADGWNQLERYGDFSMRWTKFDAVFMINDSNISKITFLLNNPKKIFTQIEVSANGHYECRDIQTIHQWDTISFQLPDVSGLVTVKVHCRNVWHPLKDFRSLGVSISHIEYETPPGKQNVDLEHDYRVFLIKQKKYIQLLMRHAKTRPKYYSRMFDYLRGPQSPDMEHWLEKNISNYDIVLAQMFPFNTIHYSFIAKKFNKPLILLPLMHVEDEFYHWGHYYDMLKEADCVFALTSHSKTEVFDILNAKCVNIGAGIEPGIFLNSNVNGSSFRKKFHLETKEIILTVSRKSLQKHYDYLIQSIDEIHNDHPDAILVMIGPDDDKIPINSANVIYLGKMSDEDLADAYDACDIFAMMSDSESFGMVFCEAWSRKKPVIGNKNCGAVATLIEDGRDGLLCLDKRELNQAIIQLLTDKKISVELGERGYQKVIKNYTWDKLADRIFNCYNKLISR